MVHGKENFKRGENYIVASNHNSYMDVPLTTPFIPGPNKTIAKSELAKVPLFGLIYQRGSILVDRKSEKSRRESYVKMKEVLDQGLHMCIYPEGTRNTTGEPLKSFHDGAFKLAGQLALFSDGFEDRLTTFFQLAQITQTGLQVTQLRVIQTAGDFLTIACNKRHGVPFIKQANGSFYLFGSGLNITRNNAAERIFHHGFIIC